KVNYIKMCFFSVKHIFTLKSMQSFINETPGLRCSVLVAILQKRHGSARESSEVCCQIFVTTYGKVAVDFLLSSMLPLPTVSLFYISGFIKLLRYA
uniref:Uncharacterized protein n=1 Tax=Erpetoichthys calabaricus TaxID=27687 RepID=A0A8C4X2R8_ERPCA